MKLVGPLTSVIPRFNCMVFNIHPFLYQESTKLVKPEIRRISKGIGDSNTKTGNPNWKPAYLYLIPGHGDWD